MERQDLPGQNIDSGSVKALCSELPSRRKEQRQISLNGNSSLPFSVTTGEQQANNQLEKCGKWLSSIPRDDITVLRHTVEFQEFLTAFERLGEAHLRVCNKSNRKTNVLQDSATHASYTGTDGDLMMTTIEQRRGQESDSSQCNDTIESPTGIRRNGNNLLRCTDDIILRILEFLRCKCLIQTSLTCSKFHQLVKKSATQRTYDIATARQLGNVMQLLRAKEQIYYVDSESVENQQEDATEDDGDVMSDVDDEQNSIATNIALSRIIDCSVVPVPTLLPGRRVLVTNAGDPEYNGVYYCTDCNGNGFVFTKPRFSSQHSMTLQQSHLEDMIFDEEINPLRQNRVVGAIQRAGRLPLENHDNNMDDDGGNNNNGDARFQPQQRRSEKFPKEKNISELPLRCVIAKAYSNHVSFRMYSLHNIIFVTI